jgi:hypothetical protein
MDPDQLVRGTDLRIQIRIRTKKVTDPHYWLKPDNVPYIQRKRRLHRAGHCTWGME